MIIAAFKRQFGLGVSTSVLTLIGDCPKIGFWKHPTLSPHYIVVLLLLDTSDQYDVPEYKVYHKWKEEGGVSNWGTNQQHLGQILAKEGILMQQYTVNQK